MLVYQRVVGMSLKWLPNDYLHFFISIPNFRLPTNGARFRNCPIFFALESRVFAGVSPPAGSRRDLFVVTFHPGPDPNKGIQSWMRLIRSSCGNIVNPLLWYFWCLSWVAPKSTSLCGMVFSTPHYGIVLKLRVVYCRSYEIARGMYISSWIWILYI